MVFSTDLDHPSKSIHVRIRIFEKRSRIHGDRRFWVKGGEKFRLIYCYSMKSIRSVVLTIEIPIDICLNYRRYLKWVENADLPPRKRLQLHEFLIFFQNSGCKMKLWSRTIHFWRLQPSLHHLQPTRTPLELPEGSVSIYQYTARKNTINKIHCYVLNFVSKT